MTDPAAPVPFPDPEPGQPGQRRADRGGRRADRGGRRSAGRGRGRSGCLPILAVIAVFAVLAWIFVPRAWDSVSGVFAGPEDFPGPGSGKVTVVIDSGQTIRSMGAELTDQGVVASTDAFVDAAAENPKAQRIQAGTYVMKKEMAAADAVAYLADPGNMRATRTVTIPEGSRLAQIVDTVAAKSDFTKAQLGRLLEQPGKIGLPAEAEGNPEGYLFPATYELPDDLTPKALFSEMVALTASVEKELQVPAGARALDLTPHELMTVASILEHEVNRPQDYPKVARVIYNRLDLGMPLQMDSTVAYVSQREGDPWTTAEERESDSLYNTYQHQGLPPGPIGSPGRQTIRAALHPAAGDWLYFVADFENGGTLFAESYSEHQSNVARVQEYCQTSDDC
ncbi:endolytic transglycosylase MltG [Nocardioides sp. YIM 152588]|uniref:endolytic transglycosylase MltG n=1 Tax=Nocardioides sp. YIM 152588 TaxID=3158259 RepID=UPI0032E3DC61